MTYLENRIAFFTAICGSLPAQDRLVCNWESQGVDCR